MDLTRKEIIRLMISSSTNPDSPKNNLTGLNLKGVDLSNLDLRAFIFKKVNFSEANLSGTNLQGVDLSDAKLIGIDCESANFSDTDLSLSTLEKCRFKDCNFNGSNFTKAKLEAITFKSSVFDNSDFSETKILPHTYTSEDRKYMTSHFNLIEKCSFERTSFINSEIKSTRIVNSVFDKSRFINSNIDFDVSSQDHFIYEVFDCFGDGQKLDYTETKVPFGEDGTGFVYLVDCSFAKVDFSTSDLRAIKMNNIELDNAIFNDCNLEQTEISSTSFKRSSLINTSLYRTKLSCCEFDDANFKGADLDEAEVLNCNISSKQKQSMENSCAFYSQEEIDADEAYYRSINDFNDRNELGMSYHAIGDDFSRNINKILFFDLETSGLPKNWKAPYTDIDNWPYIIQLGFILSDENKYIGLQNDLILEPDGFEISIEASKIHGITTKKAKEEGHDREKVLKHFADLVKESKYIVAHNAKFDVNVLRAEFIRMDVPDPFEENKIVICTMESSTDFCAIEGRFGGYKWPTLSELHIKLFGNDFEGAHDAFADIKATNECFWELIELGVISLSN